MARAKALSAYKMAKRIYNREDNVYNKKIVTQKLITDILLMYMDECRKALAEGERIEISKVGSIIPEVKVHIQRLIDFKDETAAMIARTNKMLQAEEEKRKAHEEKMAWYKKQEKATKK